MRKLQRGVQSKIRAIWGSGGAASFILNLELDGSECSIQLHSLATAIRPLVKEPPLRIDYQHGSE